MKLVTYASAVSGDSPSNRVGALTSDGQAVVDFVAAANLLGRPEQAPTSMLELIDGGTSALDRVREILEQVDKQGATEAAVPIANVTLKAPVPRPRQMRDFLSFERHVRGCRSTRFRHQTRGDPDAEAKFAAFVADGGLQLAPVWYEQPIYYKGNRMSVVGTETDVQWPSYSELLDFELEFGIFIGKPGKNIARAKASEHIFGYCIFNDFTARDTQSHESAGQLGPAKGKDFDTGNAMGPWLVTADEIAHPYDLKMVARINGEVWTDGSSRGMQHDFEAMIAHVSREETLHSGEFFGSGTTPGGCGLELDRWLSPGDTIELEVEGLGILRNHIVRTC